MPEQQVHYEIQRSEMVRDQLKARGITDARVLEAFAVLPREMFVPPQREAEVYADHPVSIGHGQTISQPYIVALMVQVLDVQPHHTVLEIGAGSGYQTAVLARLAGHVYAVERLPALTEQAMCTLGALNVTNVTLATQDGSLGWPAQGPFDRIISGAAAPGVPQPWIDQLADGGKIVLPVGGEDAQTLLVLDRQGNAIRRREICDVRFVKLIGKVGWPEETRPRG
ncbi:MAG: protein-L-isoaspartate(D-aspartate) O-methyltransferase [Phycisphaerae bacterium]|jgi:protein-L-isoaspartate(D-aspartate) O-methyltransferase